jgi:CPA2 family monovalent cation:H+ antiporter-2
VITAAVVVGKVLSCSFGTFVAGNDTRTSLRVGMGLAQIGEFSFIIASLGLTLKATSDFLYPIAVTVSAITTLLTPYLIRSADGLVNWFDRCAPARWVRHMELYTQWVSRLGNGRKGSLAARLIRKWLWQLGLNTVLTVGIFVSAAFLARSQPGWLPELPGAGGPEALKSILWFAAVLCSLPLLIASFRKMQAMAMVISEITVSRAAAGERTAGIRALIVQILAVASLIGLGLLVLVLSSTLLPPANVLLVLVLIVAGITWLLWRSFVKVYAKAQIALVETFANPPPARHAEETNRELSILKDAELRLVTVPVSGSAAHKLISELRMRTLTGASIAGIQRDGRSIINPGPDEELKPGDQVLLLGLPEQIQRAEAMLSSVDPVA